MQVYVCNDFTGFYSVGTAAVMIAADEPQARKMLECTLTALGLTDMEFTLQPVSMSNPAAYILCDGNY